MHTTKRLLPALVAVVLVATASSAAFAAGTPLAAGEPTDIDEFSKSNLDEVLHPRTDGSTGAAQPDAPIDVDALEESHLDERVLGSVLEVNPPALLLLAGYTRHDDADTLDNDVRKRVYEAVKRAPGTYPMALVDATQIPRSTIRYHVRVLEREGLIFSEKIRGKRRYFPSEMDDVELSVALKDDASATVLTAIARLEPVSVSQLADDLDRASSTVSYHLSRLTDAGLVEQERDSGTVLNRLAPQTRTEVRLVPDGAGADEDLTTSYEAPE